MSSLVPKTERIDREYGSDSQVSVAGAGKEIRIPLKRDSLVAELKVNCTLSQVFAVAPTASDIRRAFKTVSIESGDGERLVNVPFHVIYDMGRLTENGSSSTIALGTPSTAVFNFEIHFEADGAKYDALSFFRTKNLSDLVLVLTQADDASGVFTGGTTPGAQTTSVVVTAEEYPDMLADPAWGSMRQILRAESTASETGTGDKTVKLRGRNGTRFVMIHAFDTSGATPTPSDALLTNITIQQGERIKKKTRYTTLKGDNLAKRGFNVVGCVVIDQGDDETSYLDFTDASDVDLVLTVAAGAPAHKFIVSQSLFVPNEPVAVA